MIPSLVQVDLVSAKVNKKTMITLSIQYNWFTNSIENKSAITAELHDRKPSYNVAWSKNIWGYKRVLFVISTKKEEFEYTVPQMAIPLSAGRL